MNSKSKIEGDRAEERSERILCLRVTPSDDPLSLFYFMAVPTLLIVPSEEREL
jgi:hypothetical protein